jgi:hypothetical protein
MNLEQLKKNVGYRVQLLPVACRLNERNCELPSIDYDWIIETVTEGGVAINNTVTKHGILLGKDHIHHFASNPSRDSGGIRYGFLILNVQVCLKRDEIWVTPNAKPGETAIPRPEKIAEKRVHSRYPFLWTVVGVIITVLALISAFFVPEVRIFLHLQKRAPNPVAVSTTDGAKSQVPAQANNPLPSPLPIPPEVVLTADDTTYVLIWIPGTKTFPTVQPAGKSGYPALELKNLSGSPVAGVSIDWSVSGPPIEKVINSSEHFKKYKPILDQGMYTMDNGEGVGIPVENHEHTDIPYVADSTVPIDIPGGIWYNFFLRMIATKERPPDNSRTASVKTTEPLAVAVLKYHQSNRVYRRTFQIKALMFVLSNSVLIGALGQVDSSRWSPDNFRAQMRLSISEMFRPPPPEPSISLSKQRAYIAFDSTFASSWAPVFLPAPGRQLQMNVTFKNSGDVSADIFRALGVTYLGKDSTEETQKTLIGEFRKYFDAFKRPPEPHTLIPGQGLLITAFGRDVTEEDTKDIPNKSTTLFIVSEVEFTDQSGSHHMPMCVWGRVVGDSWTSLRPISMWEYCQFFNKEF